MRLRRFFSTGASQRATAQGKVLLSRSLVNSGSGRSTHTVLWGVSSGAAVEETPRPSDVEQVVTSLTSAFDSVVKKKKSCFTELLEHTLTEQVHSTAARTGRAARCLLPAQ